MMKTLNNTTWVLVADGGMAKVLASDDNSLQIIHQTQSPYQHTPSKEIAADKDGNFYSGKHHSKGNSTDLHEQAETEFITELSDILEKQFYAGKFKALILIMPAKALGKMRHCLNKNIRAVVKQEFTKDLGYFSDHELMKKIEQLLNKS